MNPNCKRELNNANSINDMIEILNKYYDLSQPFGAITGALVKARVTENFTTIIQKLGIKEKKINNRSIT